MKHIFLMLTALLPLVSCSQQNTISGNVSNDKILFEYVIYFLGNNNVEPTEFSEIIKKEFSEIKLLDSIISLDEVKGSNILITGVSDVKNQFPPMDIETLYYSGRGLNETDKQKLQDSKYAIILDFVCERDLLTKTLVQANEILSRITKGKETVLYDSETRETFSLDFWFQERKIQNQSVDISKHITIHFYQKEEFCRAITLGMSKFGLPDICIEELSCKSGLELASFINLTAQTLLENPIINNDGSIHLKIESLKSSDLKNRLLESVYENAEKEAKINIIQGTLETGDPENTLIEIEFTGENPQIAHNALFTTLFGSVDEITMQKHDERILKASNDAKAKIPELHKMFLNGLTINSHLLMKFPFEYSDGNEWMWVEITKWKGDVINGILQNEPSFIKDLKAGQKVKKDVNEMFDYILYKPDGTSEGNETGKIMQERL